MSELCQLFDIRQPALSHHLKVLANAGLVATRREGNSIFYRRSELGQRAGLGALQDSIFDCRGPDRLTSKSGSRLQTLHRKREENSRDFFRVNAAQVSPAAGPDSQLRAVRRHGRRGAGNAPLQQHQCVLEVGPGDGAFLRELAPRFDRVVALDNAPADAGQGAEPQPPCRP